MAREKAAYRDNLERIEEAFPGQEIVTLNQLSQWLHKDPRTVARMFPLKGEGRKKVKWIAVATLARELS